MLPTHALQFHRNVLTTTTTAVNVFVILDLLGALLKANVSAFPLVVLLTITVAHVSLSTQEPPGALPSTHATISPLPALKITTASLDYAHALLVKPGARLQALALQFRPVVLLTTIAGLA